MPIRRALMLSLVIVVICATSSLAGTGVANPDTRTDMKAPKDHASQRVLSTHGTEPTNDKPVRQGLDPTPGSLWEIGKTLGSVLLGAITGFFCSLKVANHTVEANRKKDNFQLRKESLETRIRSLSSLKHACNSYLVFGFVEGTPEAISTRCRQLVSGVCDVLVETPWAFSQSIKAQGSKLEPSLCMLEACCNPEVRPLLGLDDDGLRTNMVQASRSIRSDTEQVKSLAENELSQLIDEYENLIKLGIPK